MAPDPDDGEYGQRELVRWLQRVEAAVNGLRSEVVARGVYEVERAADREDLSDLRRRVDGIVNRAWWLAIACATLAVSIVGLFLKK